MDIGSPIGRHEIEIREPGLPFNGDAPDVGEPADYNFRRDRVAVSDEDVGPGPALGVVPFLTNQRNRASVFVGLNQAQNSFQNFIWETRLVRVTRLFLLPLRVLHPLLYSAPKTSQTDRFFKTP